MNIEVFRPTIRKPTKEDKTFKKELKHILKMKNKMQGLAPHCFEISKDQLELMNTLNETNKEVMGIDALDYMRTITQKALEQIKKGN